MTSTIAVTSFVAVPQYQASVEKAKISAALQFADASKQNVHRLFVLTDTLPRTAREADAIKSRTALKPEFVRDVKIRYDRAGEKVQIMAYLKPGAVEKILGGDQYVYFEGSRLHDDENTIEWQCGARNIDLMLLPEGCRKS